jgi:hypothetical protein
MTDLEELREALHTRPDEPLPELDIRQIMVAGTRLRRRQRVRTGVISLTVLAVLVGGMALSQIGRPGEVQPAGSPTSVPTVAPSGLSTPASSPTPDATATSIPASAPAMSPTAEVTSTGAPTISPTGAPTPTRAASNVPPATSGQPINPTTAGFAPDSSPPPSPTTSPTG